MIMTPLIGYEATTIIKPLFTYFHLTSSHQGALNSIELNTWL